MATHVLSSRLTRRDFLKATGAGMLTTCLAGQSLATASPIAANVTFPFSVTLAGRVQPGHTGYLVTCDEQSDEHDKYVTIEPRANSWGCQIQPFAPGEICTPKVYPIDAKGNTLPPIVLGEHGPNGLWREFIRSCDWFYDPSDDMPMQRMNPSKLFISYWRSVDGVIDRMFEPPNTFVSLNDQKHWHMGQAGGPADGTHYHKKTGGVTSVTVRPQASFATRPGLPLGIFLEVDSAADGRNLWYLAVSPHKLGDVGLMPDRKQFAPVPNTFVLTVKGPNVQADLYDSSGLRANCIRIPLSSQGFDPFTANWRGAAFRNVRQQLGVRLNKNSFTLMADRGYNGQMVTVATYPLPFDLPWWGSDVYVLISNGSYHVAKSADRPNGPVNRVGLVNGQPYLTNPRMLTHWGMIGIRAPGVTPFSTAPIPMEDGFYQMPPMDSLMNLATPFVGYWTSLQKYHGVLGPGMVIGNRFMTESMGMAMPIDRIWSDDGAEWKPPGPHLLDYIGPAIGKGGNIYASLKGRPNQVGFAKRATSPEGTDD